MPVPSWSGLLIAIVPLLIGLAILTGRGLGQARPLAIAAARMAAQLTALGFVLGAVFAVDRPWLVVAIALLMLTASAQAISSRQSRKIGRPGLEAFLSMGTSVSVVLWVSTRLALGLTPWHSAQVTLPILGMILGNSVSGLALAADRFDSELRLQRELVELRLSLGATARQAALPALRAAVKAGLTSTINGMTIAGIVSIPGMATGQILAGSDVATALRYQVLIYLMIAGTVVPGLLLMLRLRFRHYFTASQQIRPGVLDGNS